MAIPQLLSDLIRLMLLLAPSAAVLCLILAGISLRREGGPAAVVGGNFAKWMFWAIVFITLPGLISWFPSFGVPAPLPGGGVGTGWMANLQNDLASFVNNFVVKRLATSLAALKDLSMRLMLDSDTCIYGAEGGSDYAGAAAQAGMACVTAQQVDRLSGPAHLPFFSTKSSRNRRSRTSFRCNNVSGWHTVAYGPGRARNDGPRRASRIRSACRSWGTGARD
ncbi:MAG: hypothetical protein HY238_27780 [Acidobacteria bacterium]|nr:hypothetical protein [Acidobacteriota bacterium]